MAAPTVTMHQLLEAGAHFGHQTHRWNPKMKPYIFGDRNGVHILDLSQTVPLFARALDFVSQTAARGGKVLFVGTKRQAQGPIADAARASGQHFVNHRWLGGMLTNWKTISNSIKKFKTMEEQLAGDTAGLTKKEVLQLTRERDKFELSLGGIRDMGGIPDVIFVIDANKEELAIKEANVLGIPVVAILDSNVSPDGIAFPVPANDDASRAIRLYCDAIAAAATRGGQQSASARGIDLGAMDAPPVEAAIAQETPVAVEAAVAAVVEAAPAVEVVVKKAKVKAPAEAVEEAPAAEVEAHVAEVVAEAAPVAEVVAEEAPAEVAAEEAPAVVVAEAAEVAPEA
jgi:small subunit ribosomal protein S2